MTMLSRRNLITGLISFVAAPAIVRASSLMPVKMMDSFDPKEVIENIVRIRLPNKFSVTGLDIYHMLLEAKNDVLKITGINSGDFYLDSLTDDR